MQRKTLVILVALVASAQFAICQSNPESATVVARWTMRDTGTPTVEDFSGRQHNGQLKGAASYQRDPQMKNSLEISATSGKMTVPYSKDFDLARGAVETWINPKYMKEADLFNKITYKTLRTGVQGAKSVFGVHMYADGSLTGYILNDAEPQGRFWTYVPTPRRLISAGKWHHLVLQWDGHHVTLFLNGVHVMKREYKEIDGAGLSYFGEGEFTLGQGENADNTFIGRFGLTRIYRGNLTDEEVMQLAQNPPSSDADAGPYVTSIQPASASIGTQVTIDGNGFGAMQDAGTVELGGVVAQVNQWSATRIVATVPYVASPNGTAVVKQGTTSNTMAFEIVGPAIAQTPWPFATAGYGSPTIYGARFGATQGSSTVTYNGLLATDCIWNDTWVACLIPVGATSGPIVVTVNGIASNAVDYTVMPAGVITSISPGTAAVGTQITIRGNGFYPVARDIIFTGVQTPVKADSWTDEEIKVTVPAGAVSGPVVVHTWWRGMPSAPLVVTP